MDRLLPVPLLGLACTTGRVVGDDARSRGAWSRELSRRVQLQRLQMATLQSRVEERGYSRYETAQMNYSLLNRDIEHEILPFMQYSRMSLLVWSPLHAGALPGKYSKNEKPVSVTPMGNRGLFFPFFD